VRSAGLRCAPWADGLLQLVALSLSHVTVSDPGVGVGTGVGIGAGARVGAVLAQVSTSTAEAHTQAETQADALLANEGSVRVARALLLNLERLVVLSSSLSLPHLNSSVGVLAAAVTALLSALLRVEGQMGQVQASRRQWVEGEMLTGVGVGMVSGGGGVGNMGMDADAGADVGLRRMQRACLCCYHLLCRLLTAVAACRGLEKHAHLFAAAAVEALSRQGQGQGGGQGGGGGMGGVGVGGGGGAGGVGGAVGMGGMGGVSKAFQETAYPGIYALFEKCQKRQREQMFHMLEGASRARMADLHAEFVRSFKFAGK
ncbi:hypothetical protein B484DRAFT_403812, partial [Ochromonadaceae sp. CCMP2298]